MKPQLLNLGCGATFHPEWINIDLVSTTPEVRAVDVRQALPFAADSFDAVYHAHVLEHFEAQAGQKLLRECLRVLKPGGTLRVVVPDLEQISELYLDRLRKSRAGDPRSAEDYDWLLLELYDQTVRTRSGGRMKDFLLAQPANRTFILERIGQEAEAYFNAETGPRRSWGQRLRRLSLGKLSARLRWALTQFAVGLVGGRQALSWLRHGRFRASGELHLWMYDRFSLQRALEQAGARDVRVVGAQESEIPEYSRFGLDAIEGRPRKPDSLYVECRK